MSNFKIITNVLGQLQTNCYFIYNKQSNEAIIIDPSDNTNQINKKLNELNLQPVMILLTHGHIDHIMATMDIRNQYKIPVLTSKNEKDILSDANLNCSNMLGLSYEIEADQWLNDDEILNISGFDIKVIGTPGHTIGSVCYYFENEKILFSGDTLFKDSFGRYDLPTGEYATLEQSIKTKLYTLPDDVFVYPGHGEETTIEYERQYNMINNYA